MGYLADLLFVITASFCRAVPEVVNIYVGSYSSSITRISLNINGQMRYIGESNASMNPSWLTLSPNEEYLYAVSEVDNFPNPVYDYSGAVSSFFVEKDRSLTLIDTVASGGASPAHAISDNEGLYLYVSNYCSGTIGVIPTLNTGLLDMPVQVIDHNDGPVSDCSAAHVHEVVLGDMESLEVMDLGNNKVYHYATKEKQIISPPIQTVAVKSGPRHMVIHPFAPWCFVVNELDNTVSTLPYEQNSGALGNVTFSVSSLRPGENEKDMAAGEIQISKDGKVLYVSNRDNSEPNLNRSSIAVFKINVTEGDLEPVQFVYTMGDHPRHFDLFFNDSLLVVANMNSDNIVSFEVNSSSGLLTPPSSADTDSGRILKVTRPTQVLQLRKKK